MYALVVRWESLIVELATLLSDLSYIVLGWTWFKIGNLLIFHVIGAGESEFLFHFIFLEYL